MAWARASTAPSLTTRRDRADHPRACSRDRWFEEVRQVNPLKQQYFRERPKFGPGGETGLVNDMLRATTERIGANIMGKRVFDQGAVSCKSSPVPVVTS